MTTSNPIAHSSQKLVYKIGSWSCWILIAYSLITLLIVSFWGGQPESVEEVFLLLQENKFKGLLQLDLLTVLIIPAYYLLFYAIYVVLKEADHGLVSISTLLVYSGLTLFLAAPSVLSYLHLSNQYISAPTEVEKRIFIAAGEAIKAADIWRGTAPMVGGLLLQTGALIISIVMLKSGVFNKLTGYTGIVVFGLDLLHILVGFFLPTVSFVLLAIAGTFYLLWFPLVGARFIVLRKEWKIKESSPY